MMCVPAATVLLRTALCLAVWLMLLLQLLLPSRLFGLQLFFQSLRISWWSLILLLYWWLWWLWWLRRLRWLRWLRWLCWLRLLLVECWLFLATSYRLMLHSLILLLIFILRCRLSPSVTVLLYALVACVGLRVIGHTI